MREILKPALVLLAICVAIAAVLAVVYQVTKPIIAKRAADDLKAAMHAVLPKAESFQDLFFDEADAKAKNFEVSNAQAQLVKSLPVAAQGGLQMLQISAGKSQTGAIVGYVFTSLSAGYAPDGVHVTVGIDTTGKITGVRIGDQNETPGLGSKVLARRGPYLKQYNNLTPQSSNGTYLTLVKNKPASAPPEQIDAVTGATFTSRAVWRAVEASVEAAHAEMSAGGQS